MIKNYVVGDRRKERKFLRGFKYASLTFDLSSSIVDIQYIDL